MANLLCQNLNYWGRNSQKALWRRWWKGCQLIGPILAMKPTLIKEENGNQS
jgi:hypothetical protein